MGWKGALRSINAAVKATDRESQRRYKADQKRRITSEAADAVDDWKQEINDLISIHTDLPDAINSQRLASDPKPSRSPSFTKNIAISLLQS